MRKICTTIAVLAATLVAAPASADMLDLGVAGNYALVALGNGKTIGQNSGPLVGSELLGNGITAAFAGGGNGQVTGTLYYDNTVQGTNTFSKLDTPPATQLVSTSLTQQAFDSANAVSIYAQGLSATQTLGALNGGTRTVTGNGGLNVISLTSLQNTILTLSGTANDVFVFNVTGNFSTNQDMILNGVLPSHILFNLLGTSGNIFQTSGGDVLYGTFLSTRGGNFQFSNLDLDGALINTAGNVQFVSGSDMTYNNLHTVPGPIAGAGLPGLVLAFGGLLAWWRTKKAQSV